MVAAFTVDRQEPARSSAARRKIAARSSNGIADHAGQASREAATAASTSAAPAWWQVPRE